VKQMKRPIRINALAFANLVSALFDGGYTARELADVSGLSIATVRRYVNALHKAHAVHVSGWDQDDCGRYKAVQYTIGEGVDMPKPAPASKLEKRARWRSKMRNLAILTKLAGPPLTPTVEEE